MNAYRIALLFVLVTLATPAFPQSGERFTISRSVIASGGATFSTSSRFQLGSTIAQPLAAVPGDSRYSIQGGFWIWPAPSILTATKVGDDFIFSFQSELGKTYGVQYIDFLASVNWQNLPNVQGNGSVKYVTNSAPGVAQRYYRLLEQ